MLMMVVAVEDCNLLRLSLSSLWAISLIVTAKVRKNNEAWEGL
jgi:hypothetical protein